MHSGSLVDDLQQVVEVGSGLDQQSLLAPAVRPGRGDEFLRVHRLGGDDRGVGERIGDLVVGLAVQRVAVDGPGSVRIGDLCLPVRDVGVFRVAVDRVGMEADLPAGLHLIILREDDIIAVADFFLVKGHGNIAVGVRLQGGGGFCRPVRVIGGDMVHEIRVCFALRQGSTGRDGFQPDEPQGFVQHRQHDLAIFHDRPVLDHDMPQRLRFVVGKRKAPRVRVGLIDLHVVDIALLCALGKFTLCGGVGRQAEAERVVCLRVRLARRFVARDGRACDRVAQLRHQRPAGVLVCVKDGDPADAVPVRIGRQRVGQRDGTGVAQIGQTALVIGVLVDDEGEIDVGQIVQIRVPALLLRRDHDFRAVLAKGVQAVGIHEFLDLPVLIQRPVDGRRSRIAAGDRHGHGQPVVVGDHIVQKAERERQHQRLRPVIDRKIDADRVILPVLLDRSDLVLRDRGVGRERWDPDRVLFNVLFGHRQRDGQIRRIFVQISGFQPDKPGHGAVRIVADTVKNIMAQAMKKTMSERWKSGTDGRQKAKQPFLPEWLLAGGWIRLPSAPPHSGTAGSPAGT